MATNLSTNGFKNLGNNLKPQTYVKESTVNLIECKQYLSNLFIAKLPQKITFTKMAWLKINCYINLIGDLEITGFGKIDSEGIVSDIAIPKQSVKPAYCNSTIEQMQEFMMGLPREEWGQWNFDWHSHVNMGVFASGTDTANYKIMSEARLGKSFPFLIINKKQETFCANYLGNGRYDNIPVEYDREEISTKELLSVYEFCKKDIMEKCTESITYSYAKTTNITNIANSHKNYYSNSNYTNSNTNLNENYNDYYDYDENGVEDYEDWYNKQEDVKNNSLTFENNYENMNEQIQLCKACGNEINSDLEIEQGHCEDCLMMANG